MSIRLHIYLYVASEFKTSEPPPCQHARRARISATTSHVTKHYTQACAFVHDSTLGMTEH